MIKCILNRALKLCAQGDPCCELKIAGLHGPPVTQMGSGAPGQTGERGVTLDQSEASTEVM